ncbi:galactose mutarotase [Prevotella histicola]|jgi:aldose 1-epimerase|uniref:Aldose 1-epimerase n=1 Tax=Prevotella histicola TaxID=470565 RepID=A0A930HX80_9BACT|nr:aldose epimerase family protein [Prevotella histicola]MBF1391435.1 galactose mutarotase [Prevotella histicola]MBF1411167.1 galactose mutarotase [Prevotella histicola]MBF1414487.1 galactose mutarotase [Prevotella histicola]MBW4712308.1 galactose mutarotase [Prevotella histicola]MBW4738947.1 galactose mutarotase [Prevotella histicola]
MVNAEETQRVCGLKKEDFQTTVNGKKTDLYILRNKEGNEVAITNYGGAIVAIMVPDRKGNLANIIQGHDNIQDVIDSPEPYLSTLIGRYGNRIAKGRFQLKGKVYSLPINNGPNSLHGGKNGFNTKVWDATQINEHAIVLKYTSPYGEEGFTGELDVWVAYTLTDNNELIIKYSAKTNKKTIINLTHHGFFSLAGLANPTPPIDDLECQINADFFLPIDETSIPTGEILKVAETPFDFRTPKPIGQDIDADHEQIRHGSGYDHCFVLNKKEEGELSFAARIRDPKSGRTMEVYTTEPGVQVYTDNWADGYKGQHGATFPRRSAICFEAQHFPDSPNHPYFPSVILEPGREYTQKTIYKFGIQ